MEWSSTGGRRQTPGETYSRLHHGVIFPLSSCQMKLLFPRPQISGLCNNQALCHRPSPGCRGEEASEGADSHKRSSSSPLTLRSGCRITSTAATMLHARCCSLQSSQRFGPANPLKHDIKLFSQGVLTHTHALTRGTRHRADLIMKRFHGAFDPHIDSSAFFSQLRPVRSCSVGTQGKVGWCTAPTAGGGSKKSQRERANAKRRQAHEGQNGLICRVGNTWAGGRLFTHPTSAEQLQSCSCRGDVRRLVGTFVIGVAQCLIGKPCLSFPNSRGKRENKCSVWQNRRSYRFQRSRWRLVLPNASSDEKAPERKKGAKTGDSKTEWKAVEQVRRRREEGGDC